MADDFPLAQGLCHLNHAAVGPWHRRTTEAVARFAEKNARQGSLAYPHWVKNEQRLRERLARLIGASYRKYKRPLILPWRGGGWVLLRSVHPTFWIWVFVRAVDIRVS